MIKIVSFFSLAEGKDPAEVWKFWIDKHTPEIKNTPGLRKYTVSRVVKPLPGLDGIAHQPEFWVMVELWFDSEEAHNAGFKTIVNDELPSLVTNPRALLCEEVVVK